MSASVTTPSPDHLATPKEEKEWNVKEKAHLELNTTTIFRNWQKLKKLFNGTGSFTQHTFDMAANNS